MKKIVLVFKNELIAVIWRRSFLLTLFLIPLAGFAITYVMGARNADRTGLGDIVGEMLGSTPEPGLEGFVDASGIIKVIPEIEKGRLMQFGSEAEALAAYRSGQITAYYLISEDYVTTGEVLYLRTDFNPMGGQSDTYPIRYTLMYNLTDGDVSLITRLNNPMSLKVTNLSEEATRDPSHMLTFFLPYIVTLLFYITILSSASLMLNSVATEKQNRMIEIIMTSVTPMEMLIGKIFALGIAGLLQTVVWSGSGFLMLRLAGNSLNLPAEFQLPVSVLVWGLVFFLLGYALYGSLMAGLGALVPNLREASQATTVIILPVIIPLFFISVLIQEPNGVLSMILSLFPFTAPVAMMTRLSAATVPFWQPVLAVVLLLGTCYLVIRAVAGMFRAQNLLSGQTFRLRMFFDALLGRI